MRRGDERFHYGVYSPYRRGKPLQDRRDAGCDEPGSVRYFHFYLGENRGGNRKQGGYEDLEPGDGDRSGDPGRGCDIGEYAEIVREGYQTILDIKTEENLESSIDKHLHMRYT